MALWTSGGVGQYAAGEGHLALLPKAYKADGTKRGVLFAHGDGGTYLDGFADSLLCEQIAEAGWPVLSCDLGGASTWGDDDSIARVPDAKTFLQGTFGAKAGAVFLFGVSSGSLPLLGWARTNLVAVAGFVGLKPVCDLNDIHANNLGGYAASIDAAYGGGYVNGTHGPTHNPESYKASLAGMKALIETSSDDAIIREATVVSLVTAIGPSASRVDLGAGGHDADNAQLAPILAFLAANE